MKKRYNVKFYFKKEKYLCEYAPITVQMDLNPDSNIKDAFVMLYAKYGDDFDSIVSIEAAE